MKKIHEIELRRIANVLVFFAETTENFGVTKANKLLYYLDCNHLLKHGRTVLKDTYIKNQLGPVPSGTYSRLTAIHELNGLPEEDRKELFDSNHELMFEYVTVHTEQIGLDCYLDRIVPKKAFESIWFSRSEIEIMEELASVHKYTTASELVRKTHEESPYKETEMNGEIDLKLFLKDHNLPPEEIDRVAHIEKVIDAITFNYQ